MSLLLPGIYGVAAAFSGAAIYANLPTRWTIGAVVPTVAHLKAASLVKIDDENELQKDKAISGSDFLAKPTMVMAVRRPGCILCRREAAHVSDLKSLLDQAGVRLVAVVHESKGVNDFKTYFNAHILWIHERWLPHWMGFLRLGTYTSMSASKKEGFSGNTEGEGRLFGGVYFVDGDEMVWSHLEKEWGDKADVGEARTAIEKYIFLRKLRPKTSEKK